MTRNQFKKIPFKGKLVGGASYFHQSAIHIINNHFRELISRASTLNENSCKWNVVKFDSQDSDRLSFLKYQSFDDFAFPCLEKSYQIHLNDLTFKSRNHSKKNPPVLHRKELLIDPFHHNYEKFCKLTKELEKLGAFKNIIKLGTKLRWEEELQSLGVIVQGHEIKTIGDILNGS
jgi:DNA phosphorothioation-associated putative methyltransferase